METKDNIQIDKMESEKIPEKIQTNPNKLLTNELKANLIEFIKTTIIGFESGLYSHLGENMKNDYMGLVLLQFCAEHYNSVYKSLIIKDDKFIVEKFEQLENLSGHNCLCMIDILYRLTQKSITKLSRFNYNTTSYELLMESVKNQLDNIEWFENNELENLTSHSCTPILIENLDPNTKIFLMQNQ